MTAHSYHKSEVNPSSTQSPPSHIKELLASAFETLFDWLFAESNIEPKITQLQEWNGEIFWKIHDARTGNTVYCMTEFEVMEWLDARLHQQ